VSGYGVHIAVERGQLVVSDGVGRERRQGTLSRATCGLKRLVVLGHSGTISLEALRWIHDLGAAFVQIDADGKVITASSPAGLDDARLRRAQALAVWNGVGIAVARDLLRQKLEGQAAVLDRLPEAVEATGVVRQAMEDLATVETPEQLRLAEATAANAYWTAWASVPVRFARRDEQRVPDHWRTFGGRGSPITGSPRKAANPANAIANYLYAILEAEARIAALTVGLDPGMGVLHADQPQRDSLACDLMEAVRPEVDAFVLQLLQTRTFATRDFFETRQGVCRLLPPMTHLLAETAPTWAKLIAPIAEQVARTLHERRQAWSRSDVPLKVSTSARSRGRAPATKGERLPTPLTQANRRAGRDGVRRSSKRADLAASPSLPPSCRGCGVLLDNAEREYCDTCLPDNAEREYCDTCLPEQRAEWVPSFSAGGPKVLAELRAQSADPAHGGEAQRKRGQRLAQNRQEAATWEQQHRSKEDEAEIDFTRDILPQVQNASLKSMVAATGLSRRYCWLIKTGQRVAHRRHWKTLCELV
jgi:CRISPR-associated endonuclease Cas1